MSKVQLIRLFANYIRITKWKNMGTFFFDDEAFDFPEKLITKYNCELCIENKKC